jgi:hypothetical protein
MHIPLKDHVIIGKGWFSFFETDFKEGLFNIESRIYLKSKSSPVLLNCVGCIALFSISAPEVIVLTEYHIAFTASF